MPLDSAEFGADVPRQGRRTLQHSSVEWRSLVSGYRCCFSHVLRIGFSSLNAFVSSVPERRPSLLSRRRFTIGYTAEHG